MGAAVRGRTGAGRLTRTSSGLPGRSSRAATPDAMFLAIGTPEQIAEVLRRGL
ncbi:hypothetical protein [Streptomyces sp. NPDC006274]|uniref:hypothetical protein n=1 Tax=unclassified Streptomyces TaxID=2593676 RepID=UPI00339F6AE6